MRKLIYLSTLLLLFVLPMMAQHPLFPTPAKVQNGKGSFVIGKNLQVQGNGGYADKLAAGLQTELKEAGLQSSPASGTIRLELTNDCKMADEAYTLVVEPNSILLQASSEAGLFYAKEALLQLSRSAKVTCVPVRYKISPATAGAVSCSTRAATSSVKRR